MTEQKKDLLKDLVFAGKFLELVQQRQKEAQDEVVMRRTKR